MADRPRESDTAAIRVLCVDDDAEFRDLVRDILIGQGTGITVETVESGTAALERLDDGNIDCVVSDYKMPEMDGLELLSAVRADYPDLPFIMFTAQGGETVAAEAVSAGVTDYIRKSAVTSEFSLLGNRIRNVVERHRGRVQYQEIFNTVSEAVLVINPATGTVVDANGPACTLWGYPRGELAGVSVDELRVSSTAPAENPESSTADTPSVAQTQWIHEVADIDAHPDESREARFGPANPQLTGSSPVAERSEDGSTTVEWLCRTRSDDRFWGAVSQKRAVIDGRDRTLAIIRDVTRQKVRQYQLDRLLETVQDLLVVETESAIAAAVTTAVRNPLRFAAGSVFLIDDTASFHNPEAAPPGGDDDADQPIPEESDWLWEVVDSGATVVKAADSTESRESPNTTASGLGTASVTHLSTKDAPAGEHLYFPLGDIGVLRTTPGPETDPHDIELCVLLATFAAGAFDRARREALLSEREEALRDQRDELLALNHINEVIRNINQALVSVSSRDGIEQVVCEKFVASDRYAFAWTGEFDPSTRVITPRASAGVGEGYLDNEVRLASDDADPLAEAIRGRTVTVLDRISPQTAPQDRYRRARDRGFRSAAYIPVVHEDVMYLILAVYADQAHAFGSREQAVLEELGETIGHALAAVEWRRARVSEAVVELELEVEHHGGLFSLSTAPETAVELTDMQENPDGSLRVFGRLRGTTFEEFERTVRDVAGLGDPVLLQDNAELRVSFTIRVDPLVTVIKSEGISLVEGIIEDGIGRFRLSVPAGTDIRRIVEQFEDAYDSVTLIGRRDRTRDRPQTGDGDLSAVLTDRQAEALRVAYHAGYFDSPRQATGTDIGDILGISQPTFNEHLRNAQRRLLDQLVG